MHLILLVPAAMLGLLVLVLSVRRPLATIVPVYAALVPFGDVFSLRVPLPKPFNSLSSVVGALTIVTLVIHLLLVRRGRVPTLPVGLWLAFLGWGALTFLWAQDPTNVSHEVLIAAPLLLLLVLVSMVTVTRAELYRVRDAIVLSGAGVGAYGLLLMLAGKALPAHGLTDRFSVAANPSNTNPNQLAAALLLPAMLAIGLVLEGRTEGPRWRPWFGGVSAVLTAFAMAISGSRGGALAGVVGFATLLILWYRWRPWQRDRVRRVVAGTAIGGVVVIVLLAIIVALFPQGKVASIVTNGPLQRLTQTSSSSGRAEIWTTGAIACRTYCAVGAGMSNFPIVYSQAVAFSDVTRNVGISRPGHNLYLETVVEMGVVGFALFWIAIGSEFRSLRARRSFDLTAALTAAIVAILLADFFEAFLWFKHAWLPFMMVRLLEGAYAAEPVREAIGRFRMPAVEAALPAAGPPGIDGGVA
ncbi:MAG: O-antigen ligase family protein [Actinomycetota bacterium]